MDADFGTLLDLLDELNIADNTIVVFAGDNGPEDTLPWRGTAGFWDGSYFTGMEGSLRTPCLIRWPGHVAPGRVSNEIVHVTDMFRLATASGQAPVTGAQEGVGTRIGEGDAPEGACEPWVSPTAIMWAEIGDARRFHSSEYRALVVQPAGPQAWGGGAAGSTAYSRSGRRGVKALLFKPYDASAGSEGSHRGACQRPA